jgi:hypothetical protein
MEKAALVRRVPGLVVPGQEAADPVGAPDDEIEAEKLPAARRPYGRRQAIGSRADRGAPGPRGSSGSGAAVSSAALCGSPVAVRLI